MIREKFSIKIEKQEGTRSFQRKVEGTFYSIGISTNGFQTNFTSEMTREEMQVLIGYLVTWDNIEKEKERDARNVESLQEM
jgi:hypothetical protein